MKALKIIITLFIFSIFLSLSVKGQTLSGETPELPGKAIPTDRRATIQILDILSMDQLIMKADFYFLDANRPTIILCHQAGSSRGEYLATAPEFNKLGYNCLAIDQRSGKEMNNVTNETAKRAKEGDMPTTYLDAEQDIKAAIRWVKLTHPNQDIILLGSSYSASLVLKVAQEEDAVTKVLSFSPGEYFGDKFKVTQSVENLNKPTFITCSKSEKRKTKKIYKAIASKNKKFFAPRSKGNHGSKALWGEFEDHQSYWKAVKKFLNK